MPLQPCHQQRWRALSRSTSNISSQDARNREPASRHHTKVGDLLLQAPLQAKPARVLPQYDERSLSTSLDSQPMHGGADATGQSAIANDATAPSHRRRNPGESLRGGPTLPEPAIPPVAVGHERESISSGAATSRASDRHRVLDGRHQLKRFAMEQVGEVDYLITWRDNELVPHTSVVVRVRIRRCFAFPKSPSCLRLFSRLPALLK